MDAERAPRRVYANLRGVRVLVGIDDGQPAEPPVTIPDQWRVPTLEEMADIPPYNPGGVPGYDPSPGVPDGYRPGDK